MPNNKIVFDLSILDEDISTFDKVIEGANEVIANATKERELKIQLRDYIISNYVTPKISTKTVFVPKLDIVGKNTTQVGGVGQPTGISDFIRHYIKSNPNVHTVDIGKAYADNKNVPLDATLKKMISRTLTRLKNAKKIGNKRREGGKRAGSNWVYIENNQNLLSME